MIEKGAPARGKPFFLRLFSVSPTLNILPVRSEGATIFSPQDPSTPIGRITSGIPSPSLKQNIAMGYVETKGGLNKKGSEVLVEVRGKMRKAQVVAMPWIKPGYYRGD